MRLSLAVNGTPRVTAKVDGPGYLSAHLNVHEQPKDSDFSKTATLKGIQTLQTETIFLDWPKTELQTGDTVEIRLLPDGDGDPPTEVQRSSESPRNLFSSVEHAKELMGLVADFEARLLALVRKIEASESAEEHKKFANAVGRVMCELGASFLYPIYRRHAELIPDELKGELL